MRYYGEESKSDYEKEKEFIEKKRLAVAKKLSSIEHPNLLRIEKIKNANMCHHEITERDIKIGNRYCILENFCGENFCDVIRKFGPLVPPIAVKLFIQVLDVLSFVSQQGINHPNLRPECIMVNRKGVVKVDGFLDYPSMTAKYTNYICIDNYASPEKLDSNNIDVPSNIFSLGSVMFFVLTGFPPFSGSTPGSIIERIKYKDPVSLKKIVCNIGDLDDIVMKALSKNTADRFDSFDQFQQALLQLNL
ncbi:protein kinase domain-containing protein [Candidatus Uabimicrobium amorphum]|uniref:Serine/threonine protein kinase n=1 Tax=Uabimicrobium amorphum TaxID=2596890 RepID=A0A5S9F1Q1_UABAM|nr:protein kinase [Candidatus Uabimicrobium amorphum]BBM82806.1 serine/threonine protein kinase [Candidatus Uabimicrobium amorphum]